MTTDIQMLDHAKPVKIIIKRGAKGDMWEVQVRGTTVEECVKDALVAYKDILEALNQARVLEGVGGE